MTGDPPSGRPLTSGFSPDLTVLNASQFHRGSAPWDLTRKRSQVQTLSRPPSRTAGQSTASGLAWSTPCTPGPRWGRAPILAVKLVALPSPSTRASASTTTTESSRASSPRWQPRGGCGPTLPRWPTHGLGSVARVQAYSSRRPSRSGRRGRTTWNSTRSSREGCPAVPTCPQAPPPG
jgi:hypothetical protein